MNKWLGKTIFNEKSLAAYIIINKVRLIFQKLNILSNAVFLKTKTLMCGLWFYLSILSTV